MKKRTKIVDEKIKDKSFFDYLNDVTVTKIDFDDTSDTVKNYTPYLINRYISMCNMYIPYVNEINKFNVSKSVHYKYFQTLLPQRKQYFSYIQKKKKFDVEVKQKIASYFQISIKEVEKYAEILSEQQFNEICNAFDYGKQGSSSKTKKAAVHTSNGG